MHPETCSVRKRSAPEASVADPSSTPKRSKLCSNPSAHFRRREHNSSRLFQTSPDLSPVSNQTPQTISIRSSENNSPVCGDNGVLYINSGTPNFPAYQLAGLQAGYFPSGHHPLDKFDPYTLSADGCHPLSECRPPLGFMSYDFDCGPGRACTSDTCDDGVPCPSGSLERCDSPDSCLGEICYDQGCLQNAPEQTIVCNQSCPEVTRCVDPCPSPDCQLRPGGQQTSHNAPQNRQWRQSLTHDALARQNQPAYLGIQQQAHTQANQFEVFPNPHYPHEHTEDCGCIDPSHIMREQVHLPDRYHGFNYHHGHSVLPEAPYYQPSPQQTIPQEHFQRTNEIRAGETLLGLSKSEAQPAQHQSAVAPAFSRGTYEWDEDLSIAHNEQLLAGHRLHASNLQRQQQQQGIGPALVSQMQQHHYQEPALSPTLNTSFRASSQNASGISLANEETGSFTCLWLSGAANSEIQGKPCGAVFEDAEQLQRHVDKAHIEGLMREDKEGKGFYCRWKGCNRNGCRSFQARPKLKRHAQVHTMYKPFTCRTCGAMMKTKDAMEKHERTHTGKRPYACDYPGCTKRFATSTELRTHRVVHSGEKPHKCDICQECFADSSNLSKHRKTHYVGMYVCPVCNIVMKRWDQMRRHLSSQGHAEHLLSDERAEREYKEEMLKRYSMLSDEEKRCIRGTSHGRASAEKWEDTGGSSFGSSPVVDEAAAAAAAADDDENDDGDSDEAESGVRVKPEDDEMEDE